MKRVLLILSAIAFYCLHIHQSSAALSVAVSVPFLLFFAIRKPELAVPRRIGMPGKVLCALTAMGACLWPIDGFAGWLRSITVFQRLQGALGVEMALLSLLAAAAFAVAGLLFVYRMVCLFWEKLTGIAREIAGDFTRAEWLTAGAAALVLMIVAISVYLQTDAFASPIVTRDLIYTADSGAIVHENAFLSLSAIENDFRSPLFAVFAAPLLGLPYLIGRVLPMQNAVAAVQMAAQVPLLVLSFVLLMKMIRGVSAWVRLLLPLVMLCTYSAQLFTLLAEQYIVALFYFSLCLYSLAEHGRREQLLILGAAGTMLPGAALALLPEREGKPLAAVLRDTLHSALWGLTLLCTFAGFGVLWNIPGTLLNVGRFTGATVTMQSRLLQFLSFVGQIFFAPEAGGAVAADGYWKWRLAETGGVSVAGIVILALALAGFVLNRRQAFAKLSMLWVGVSGLLLCVLGWGTAENGLTLYTLYFGWAYAALLIYLAEALLRRVKFARFSWAVYTLGAAAMLLYNLPRLRELIVFAKTYYPL